MVWVVCHRKVQLLNVTEDRADARDQASKLYTGIPGDMSWG